MIKFIDILMDGAWGDAGKSAVLYELHKRPEYTHSLKSNGGGNRGGTLYHNGKKYVAHQLPLGLFFNKPSIVGPGCVLNVDKFFEEIQALENIGINTKNNILIANNVHIVTKEHIAEESNETKVGTTKQGVGPCYRDKYNRSGIRAESISELKPYLIDMYEYFYDCEKEIGLLCEGAQGFHLDIDHGNYPYVTSSQPTVAGALQNGLPWNKIRKVYGCAKSYDTYVGSMKFEPNEPIFNELRQISGEFGATTGRPRQCNWLNISSLRKAIKMNGVTNIVLSKLDMLRELNNKHYNKYWNVIIDGNVCNFSTEAEYKTYVESMCRFGTDVQTVEWRNSPTDGVLS